MVGFDFCLRILATIELVMETSRAVISLGVRSEVKMKMKPCFTRGLCSVLIEMKLKF